MQDAATSREGTSDIPRLGQGVHWQDLEVGQTFRTFRRTITEADLVNFISATGMLERSSSTPNTSTAPSRAGPCPLL